jgi:hypothetical protein
MGTEKKVSAVQGDDGLAGLFVATIRRKGVF